MFCKAMKVSKANSEPIHPPPPIFSMEHTVDGRSPADPFLDAECAG